MLSNLTAYLESSSVHGVLYLKTGRNMCERLFWSLVILAGLSMSLYSILLTYFDWTHSPTITTIETFTHPITKVSSTLPIMCDH